MWLLLPSPAKSTHRISSTVQSSITLWAGDLWGHCSFPKRRTGTHSILTTQFPCIALSLRKCKLWRTAGEMAALAFRCLYQLVPKPGWGWPHSRKHLRCSKRSGPGFHLVMGELRTIWENHIGATKSTDNAPFSFYTVCPTLDNLPWHLGRNNIGNSKQNIPEVILVHSVAYVVSNNILPSLIIFFFGHA